ncbi:ATP-grasp fold amidoligase family protein [Paenibacillus sp. FSL R10-2779]|uniref:ATP-grasp fold amidoligase family protein n=1 Tax=Paenibacillus sp. FSL R10-2779 TaxID=2975340 RepID=UPI0030F6800B
MDYKKIIKNQKVRLMILNALNFVPDKLMIKVQYKIKTGKKLDLEKPKRYTEKLQWYKIFYRDPIMAQCADKYSVREYVKSKGLSDILNVMYRVYDDVSEIDLNELPNEFVLKTTNGGGGNNVILCRDKRTFDDKENKRLLTSWLQPKKKNGGREWVYYNSKVKIIAERLLPLDENNDLPDYKFFCFYGKVYCLYTMIDYTENHSNGKLGFYDSNFNKLPYRRMDFMPIDKYLEIPKNFKRMIEIAELLSKDFPHVRVDLYNINGEIIFGELTFFNASGYTKFEPDEFDFILGEQFNLPLKNV